MRAVPFEQVLQCSWSLISSFYSRTPELNLSDYISFEKGQRAEVRMDEVSDQETVYLSVCFPLSIKERYESEGQLDLQTLSIVSEELSHFFHLVSAAEIDGQLSLLQLEALGEIDRFVSFLHWNSFHPRSRLTESFLNCRQVCDALFENRTFHSQQEQLYREAESLAFHHLRRAFSHCWTNQRINARIFDPRAREYISTLFGMNRTRTLTA